MSAPFAVNPDLIATLNNGQSKHRATAQRRTSIKPTDISDTLDISLELDDTLDTSEVEGRESRRRDSKNVAKILQRRRSSVTEAVETFAGLLEKLSEADARTIRPQESSELPAPRPDYLDHVLQTSLRAEKEMETRRRMDFRTAVKMVISGRKDRIVEQPDDEGSEDPGADEIQSKPLTFRNAFRRVKEGFSRRSNHSLSGNLSNSDDEEIGGLPECLVEDIGIPKPVERVMRRASIFTYHDGDVIPSQPHALPQVTNTEADAGSSPTGPGNLSSSSRTRQELRFEKTSTSRPEKPLTIVQQSDPAPIIQRRRSSGLVMAADGILVETSALKHGGRSQLGSSVICGNEGSNASLNRYSCLPVVDTLGTPSSRSLAIPPRKASFLGSSSQFFPFKASESSRLGSHGRPPESDVSHKKSKSRIPISFPSLPKPSKSNLPSVIVTTDPNRPEDDQNTPPLVNPTNSSLAVPGTQGGLSPNTAKRTGPRRPSFSGTGQPTLIPSVETSPHALININPGGILKTASKKQSKLPSNRLVEGHSVVQGAQLPSSRPTSGKSRESDEAEVVQALPRPASDLEREALKALQSWRERKQRHGTQACDLTPLAARKRIIEQRGYGEIPRPFLLELVSEAIPVLHQAARQYRKQLGLYHHVTYEAEEHLSKLERLFFENDFLDEILGG